MNEIKTRTEELSKDISSTPCRKKIDSIKLVPGKPLNKRKEQPPLTLEKNESECRIYYQTCSGFKKNYNICKMFKV